MAIKTGKSMSLRQSTIEYQAECHPLIETSEFHTVGQYCAHLFYLKSYEEALRYTYNKNVLDLGCNNGWGSSILSSNANKVTGVDVSERAIFKARSNHQKDNLNFAQINGIDLPFENDHFDVITSFQVIEHIAEYDLYFSGIKKVLKPEGIAIFSTPNAAIRLDPGMKPWNPMHVYEFNAEEFKTILQKHFNSVELKGLFAEEPINSIEYERVQKELSTARSKIMGHGHGPRNLLKDRIKSHLPEFLLKAYRRSRNSVFSQKTDSAPSVSDLEQYSSKNLYFDSNNLDNAIHLLAICSKPTRS